IRAVVLTGAGDKAFCAGGDVAGFGADPSNIALLVKEMTACFHAAISRFAWMDAPLIGMVNGVAAGAGLSLTACCDLVVATDTATFTSAYTQIGLSPDGSSTYFLPRLIGVRRTAELYLTNRVLSAQEALDWGLVNQVVRPDALRSTVSALVAKLVRGPAQAHGAVKRLLLMSTDTLESQMEREARHIAELSQAQDGLEGVRAFCERRKPVFS
ncbi:MAG: enoyl-CoA hydratase/isomerase family protein, partial [Luteimonas sp.]